MTPDYERIHFLTLAETVQRNKVSWVGAREGGVGFTRFGESAISKGAKGGCQSPITRRKGSFLCKSMRHLIAPFAARAESAPGDNLREPQPRSSIVGICADRRKKLSLRISKFPRPERTVTTAARRPRWEGSRALIAPLRRARSVTNS